MKHIAHKPNTIDGFQEEQKAVMFFALFSSLFVFSIFVAILLGSSSVMLDLQPYINDFENYFCLTSICR